MLGLLHSPLLILQVIVDLLDRRRCQTFLEKQTDQVCDGELAERVLLLRQAVEALGVRQNDWDVFDVLAVEHDAQSPVGLVDGGVMVSDMRVVLVASKAQQDRVVHFNESAAATRHAPTIMMGVHTKKTGDRTAEAVTVRPKPRKL